MHTKLPPVEAVNEQMERLERSPMFVNSGRLVAFLRYVVDAALKGEAATLKESVIGNAVYGREPSYDSRIDSTVRVEARRLRRKLAEYYEGPGRQDAICIALPVGTYIPWFSDNRNKAVAAFEDNGNSEIFRKGPGCTVVVLPLKALTGRADDQVFADGVTDELLYALARAEGWRIASRGTTFQYRDTSQSLSTLAEELGADAFVQGTVRGDTDLLRITVEIANPKGFVLWSDRFDVRDTERLSIQEQLAATLLSRLRLDSSLMRARAIGPGPVALEAFAKIGRARQLLDQQTPSSLYEALQIFQQVARSAPDYARGHSGIADCYCDMYRLGMIDPGMASSAARAAVERALQIDPGSVEAHCSSATIASWLDRSRTGAEAEFQQALRLGENARAARLYAVLLTIAQRHEEAERLFWEARVIEPFAIQQDIAEAISHYQARRFAACIAVATGSLVRRPSPEVSFYRALAHVFNGEEEAALAAMREIEQTTIKHPDLVFARVEIGAWLGDTKRAKSFEAGSGEATWFARATLRASLGDVDGTLEALRIALDRRELSTVWIRSDARFDFLRRAEAFTDLLQQIDAQRTDLLAAADSPIR